MLRKPAVGFIFITLVLDVFRFALIIPVLPMLVEQLHGGGAQGGALMYGWLIGLYALMQFIFAPILGSLSDRFGRRPVILVSLLGAGLDLPPASSCSISRIKCTLPAGCSTRPIASVGPPP